MKAAAGRAIGLLGTWYWAVGIIFGAQAGQAASSQARMAWRWAAWAVSIVAFGFHLFYEQIKLRSSPKVTALHLSSAAGLGAFLLAAAANIHARVAPQRPSTLLTLSLVIWPVITALPAFVVGLGAALVTDRVRRRPDRFVG